MHFKVDFINDSKLRLNFLFFCKKSLDSFYRCFRFNCDIRPRFFSFMFCKCNKVIVNKGPRIQIHNWCIIRILFYSKVIKFWPYLDVIIDSKICKVVLNGTFVHMNNIFYFPSELVLLAHEFLLRFFNENHHFASIDILLRRPLPEFDELVVSGVLPSCKSFHIDL